MCSAGNPFGQLQFANRPVVESRGIKNQTVGRVGVHIAGQGDQIAVVLASAVHSWGHCGPAAVHAVGKTVATFVAGNHVVANQAVE